MSTTIPFVRLDSHMGTTINFLTCTGPVTVRETHASFDEILDEMAQVTNDAGGALEFASDDEAERFLELCRSGVRASKIRKVVELTGLLTYDGEDIMFHDNKIINPVVDHITELYDAGNEDWKPLARFLERLQHNPDPHSRVQLYTWMNENGLVVSSDGRLIAYKGLTDTDTSTYSGGAYINGLWFDGVVKNTPGDTISLQRSQVVNDPNRYCAYGLHVGSFDYASGYAGKRMATVVVDPRHVVSVPEDFGCAKVRVCEYTVVAIDDKPDCLYRGRYGVLILDLPDADDTNECYELYCPHCPDCGDCVHHCTCDDDESYEDIDYCPDCGEDLDYCECCDDDAASHDGGEDEYCNKCGMENTECLCYPARQLDNSEDRDSEDRDNEDRDNEDREEDDDIDWTDPDQLSFNF